MAALNGSRNGTHNGSVNGVAADKQEPAAHGVALDPDEYKEFRRQLDDESDEAAEKLRTYLTGEVVKH